MKISNTPNPMLTNSMNAIQLLNKKSIVSEGIADIAAIPERKDSFIQSSPLEKYENITYDPNAQLSTNPNHEKNYISNEKVEEIDYSKINGIVSEELRKPTEEETRLLNLSMEINGYGLKQVMQTMIELGNALNLTCVNQGIDELYAMYDKKFGTDSSNKVQYFNSMRKQVSNVSQMLSSLSKALDAGKTRNDVMNFAPDNSFSKDEFDYVMNIADHYDYKNHELTNKDAVKTNNSNVSPDLSSILGSMFA